MNGTDRFQIRPRADCGLPEDAFVFCSFNQAVKITPEIFAVWMKLLGAIGGSVLWLQRASAETAKNIHGRAQALGIEPERIIFAPFEPEREQHLGRLGNADLALDCFPYGSHVTAGDALAAGVPLVALIGDTLVSRGSSSVLTAADLPELIATSLDGYFALALRLANDRAALATLKSKLSSREQVVPLFDTRRFTRNLETAFATVWERCAAGLAPDHVTVTVG